MLAFDIAPYHIVEMTQNASQNILYFVGEMYIYIAPFTSEGGLKRLISAVRALSWDWR